MAFCTGCGADVTGKNFCMSCGKPVGSAPPAAGPPQPPAPAPGPPPSYGYPSAAAPQQAYGAPPPQGPPMQMGPKKTSPWVWVIVGVLGFFLLVGIVITVGVGMFVHKVKSNPALAMAKLLTAANPDVEVLEADEGRNSVKIKDKKTGETITVNLDDLKNGRINLRGPKGERATIDAHTDGQNGTVEINGPDGSMKFGAGANAKLPDWVPAYPGATAVGTFSVQGGDGGGGTFSFTTKDSPDTVLTFYKNALTGAGFKITANINGTANGASGNMITAEDEATKRTFVVTVGTDGGNTTANVIYGNKK